MITFNTIFREQSIIADCRMLPVDEKLVDFVKKHGIHMNQFNPGFDPELASGPKENTGHVLVMGGGMSAEREVSYMSSDGIVRSLCDLGYRVTFMDMGADVGAAIMKVAPDVVFNALHGTYGEDGCLPGLLNMMRIPYTGCGVLASSLAFNKKKSAEIFRANDIRIARSVTVRKSDNLKTDPLTRPYVIKPLSQGSSIGIEMVFPEDKFDFASYDFPYGEEIIVEEYIRGREMQIAVLDGKALGVLELKLLKGKRFNDYETKYTEGFAQHLMPAPISSDVYQNIISIAEKVSNIFECKGIVRVELIYDEVNQEYYTLELNTHPGMTPLSMCPEIAAYRGISYSQLVKIMLEEAAFEQ